ncbi:MAG: SDR family oxidoreductase [Ignavibacteriaceae bacterium]|jgi:short-subunit dehydrogenase
MTKQTNSGIWITGASSGIGRAAAIEFAKTGAEVFVSSRRAAELERLQTYLSKEKSRVEIFPCNVASPSNVERTVKKIIAGHQIDCLINNAGVTSFKKAEANSIQEINDVINTNLLGAIYTIKYVLPHMIERGGGTIINIISIAAKKVFTHSSAYAASKSGLLAYTNSLREEVREYNIRIINIVPGAIETSIWPDAVRKENAGRMMKAEDIGQLLVRLYLQKGNIVTEEIVVRPITGDLS